MGPSHAIGIDACLDDNNPQRSILGPYKRPDYPTARRLLLRKHDVVPEEESKHGRNGVVPTGLNELISLVATMQLYHAILGSKIKQIYLANDASRALSSDERQPLPCVTLCCVGNQHHERTAFVRLEKTGRRVYEVWVGG